MECPALSLRLDWQTGSFRLTECSRQFWRWSVAKVLIVDDSAMSRRILRSILEGGGHNVIEAEDGMVALEKYFLDKPHIVLLDLIMKGMVGMEVLEKLREMDGNARVIVASADI